MGIEGEASGNLSDVHDTAFRSLLVRFLGGVPFLGFSDDCIRSLDGYRVDIAAVAANGVVPKRIVRMGCPVFIAEVSKMDGIACAAGPDKVVVAVIFRIFTAYHYKCGIACNMREILVFRRSSCVPGPCLSFVECRDLGL